MSKPLNYQILTRARQLITNSNNWAQGSYFLDNRRHSCHLDQATKFCALGAIRKANYELTGCKKLKPRSFKTKELAALSVVNDREDHAAVLRIMDDMISKL